MSRMNHEIKEAHALLDEKGRLIEPGYTKGLFMDYDRAKIKAKPMRIKEWDYYLVTTNDYAVALTIADNSYMGLDSISLLDFRIPWEHTKSPMQVLTRGKKNLPPTSLAGDVRSGGKKYSTLLNSVPLDIADRDPGGADHLILWFTRESAEEAAAVAENFKAGRKSARENTGGLYFRKLL